MTTLNKNGVASEVYEGVRNAVYDGVCAAVLPVGNQNTHNVIIQAVSGFRAAPYALVSAEVKNAVSTAIQGTTLDTIHHAVNAVLGAL